MNTPRLLSIPVYDQVAFSKDIGKCASKVNKTLRAIGFEYDADSLINISDRLDVYSYICQNIPINIRTAVLVLSSNVAIADLDIFISATHRVDLIILVGSIPSPPIIDKLITIDFTIWTLQEEDSLMTPAREVLDVFSAHPCTIFKRNRFQKLSNHKIIQACESDCTLDIQQSGSMSHTFQYQINDLLDLIESHILRKSPLSVMRIGDGDFYFMNALPVGSAKPGTRALTLSYKQKRNLHACRASIWKNDYLCVETVREMNGSICLLIILDSCYRVLKRIGVSVAPTNRIQVSILRGLLLRLSSLLSSRLIRHCLSPTTSVLARRFGVTKTISIAGHPQRFNFETIYASVANRAIFRIPSIRILLVGQTEKIIAVKSLMKDKRYREYLGIQDFCGYLGIPKIGAADNEDLILSDLKQICTKTSPDLILLGIGSAKLYVMPRIREFSTAVAIDIGAGVDALAGVISQDRPFFANWVNFKSNNIDYDSMDLMDTMNDNRDSPKYLSYYLD